MRTAPLLAVLLPLLVPSSGCSGKKAATKANPAVAKPADAPSSGALEQTPEEVAAELAALELIEFEGDESEPGPPRPDTAALDRALDHAARASDGPPIEADPSVPAADVAPPPPIPAGRCALEHFAPAEVFRASIQLQVDGQPVPARLGLPKRETGGTGERHLAGILDLQSDTALCGTPKAGDSNSVAWAASFVADDGHLAVGLMSLGGAHARVFSSVNGGDYVYDELDTEWTSFQATPDPGRPGVYRIDFATTVKLSNLGLVRDGRLVLPPDLETADPELTAERVLELSTANFSIAGSLEARFVNPLDHRHGRKRQASE